MPIKAVIFDLDGTLLNTLDDLADACNDILRARGYPTHATAEYRDFVGNGARKLVESALPADARGGTLVTACLADYRAAYAKHWNVKTRPYEGIAAMLEALSAGGIAMAVLTNKPDDAARACVNEYFPAGIFHEVVGQRPDMPLKPDPTSALASCARLGTVPAECAFVGDSRVDMETAVAAGMYPVGVRWGFRPERELVEHGAAVTIGHPSELPPLLV